MELRTCNKCKEVKPLEGFYKVKRGKSGRTRVCVACYRKDQKEYYKKNRESFSKRWRDYAKNNKEKRKNYHAEHYKENKERICKERKEYRNNNKEKVRRQNNELYHKYMADPAIRKQRLATKAKYEKGKRENNPVYRITCNMRGGMYRGLKGLHKTSRTFSYIDKSPEELMNYLEKQFTEGMSRENYGEWHVDHIRPLASFEFDKYKEGSAEFEALLGEAWHYTNLQPLWATDNISKGATWGPVEKD
jgi:hypothetical protein